MTEPAPSLETPALVIPTEVADGQYTVVARRYRPKDFTELVGQQTIVQALTTAIQTNRVGHAYLFTGARGVGKTSSARIFAKALNASTDGSGHFDVESDVAQAIDSGEDLDVLEIDGASNRGIDEIRQLRANVAVRPSRSPYKIYIIDEVHMLTGQAFNALLKTLEEPPPHVKFIFCTTDPEKIPITVLSRCQRFDFAPVKSDQIIERLKFICQNEGAEADAEALQLIARRAAGSMRDSQSLLEQILSFSAGKITTETVHAMLGTADESRLASIADSMIARDPAALLSLVDVAITEGVDAGQLGEQLLGYLRDMMAIGVGGSPDLLRTANVARTEELAKSAKAWGTMTLLSAIQLLDESLVRMKHSTQSRILLEVAVVQICQLQDLQALTDLLRALQAGKSPPTVMPSTMSNDPVATPVRPSAPTADEMIEPAQSSGVSAGSASQKKKRDVDPGPDAVDTPANLSKAPIDVWLRSIRSLDGYVADCASMVVRIDPLANGSWNILFPQGCNFALDVCSAAEHRIAIEDAMRAAVGAPLQLNFQPSNLPPRPTTTLVHQAKKAVISQPHLIRQFAEHPQVMSLLKTIEGEIVRIDPAADESKSSANANTAEAIASTTAETVSP
ncbi:MAG: DNA polymerase III subunit gamma/tau [Pirellulaceae bacterium]|nr:DNA polymerase III subunit gamma/tau [Pirellulaceae bacterium]